MDIRRDINGAQEGPEQADLQLENLHSELHRRLPREAPESVDALFEHIVASAQGENPDQGIVDKQRIAVLTVQYVLGWEQADLLHFLCEVEEYVNRAGGLYQHLEQVRRREHNEYCSLLNDEAV